MGPGQAAYEARKQQKKDAKMDYDNLLERRQKREAAAEVTIDLIQDALTAFLTGKASLVVETVDDNTRRISFAIPA